MKDVTQIRLDAYPYYFKHRLRHRSPLDLAIALFLTVGAERANLRADLPQQSERVVQRLAERNIVLRFDDSALDRLAKAGYDPVYGARPLKRALQALVENPLARSILDGQFAAGDVVEIVDRDGVLAFEAGTSAP